MSLGFSKCTSVMDTIIKTSRRKYKNNEFTDSTSRLVMVVDRRGNTFFVKDRRGELKPTTKVNEFLDSIDSGLHVNERYQLSDDKESRTVAEPVESVLECCHQGE